MIPSDPGTAALAILSTAVTGLAGLLGWVVRRLIVGDLIPRQTVTDERAVNKRLLDESQALTATERQRADLATAQLEVALEQGRTTVALLHSLDRRAAQAAEGRAPGVVEQEPAGT
jgi:hypothetical protein